MTATSGKWHANDAPFTEPSNKNGKGIYGTPELKPQTSKPLKLGVGLHRKIYSSEFKPKTTEYAQSAIEGGKGPRGTVGISYATQAQLVGIADKAILAAWIKNRFIYQQKVPAAAAVSVTTGTKKPLKSLSVGVERLPSHVEGE